MCVECPAKSVASTGGKGPRANSFDGAKLVEDGREGERGDLFNISVSHRDMECVRWEGGEK